MSNPIEKLMVEIMHLLSDLFPNQAILKGGMELRLLDCPRNTNDLDYIFIPFDSKKDISELLTSALTRIPDINVQLKIHSTCIRYVIEKGNTKVQLEINVDKECPSEPLSTSSLALGNGLPPRVIRAMNFSVALSHKLAAWNERDLIRDLYDISFMVNVLGIQPDLHILKKRLDNVHYRFKTKIQKKTMSIDEFIEKLVTTAQKLTPEAIEIELRDYLSMEELPGLDKKIKNAISKVIGQIQMLN
jgi:hypothetical protein